MERKMERQMVEEGGLKIPVNDSFEQIMHARRSIRKFKPEAVPAEWVESAIACSTLAPSPSNSQPVRFVRIVSPDVREDLCRCMIERRDNALHELEAGGGSKKTKNLINAYFRYSEFLFNAPVILCVGTEAGAAGFSKKLRDAGIIPEDFRGEADLDITVGLSVMALLLKSASLGLGTCILSAPLVFLPDIEARMGLEGVRIKCFIAMGFPDETPARPERKSPSEIYREI